MKVLFLDFDGVLNSERLVRLCKRYGVIIDPSCMKMLKNIIDRTGAKIVLTTSWREHWGKNEKLCDGIGKEINSIFAEYQLKIYDKTPKLNTSRENEIKAWLKNNAQVEAFAVVDDAFLDNKILDGCFVKTSNYKNGLDEEAVEKIIDLLSK